MEDIIRVLESGQKKIADDFNSLLKCGSTGPELFLKLEQSVMNHISKFEAEVYAPLRKLIKLSEEEERVLDESRRDLDDIKILSLVFFEKFKGEDAALSSQGFKDDAARLLQRLNVRFKKESEHFFPFLLNLWKKFCGD